MSILRILRRGGVSRWSVPSPNRIRERVFFSSTFKDVLRIGSAASPQQALERDLLPRVPVRAPLAVPPRPLGQEHASTQETPCLKILTILKIPAPLVLQGDSPHFARSSVCLKILKILKIAPPAIGWPLLPASLHTFAAAAIVVGPGLRTGSAAVGRDLLVGGAS